MWTLDEGTRRRYVRGMVCLSVWYVRTLLERGEIPPEGVEDALSTRVDLYRFTDHWNGTSSSGDGVNDAAWRQQTAQLAAWVREIPIEATEQLELQALAYLEPTLEKRLPKDVGPPPQRPFECWTYELGWAGMADRRGLLGKLSNGSHVGAILRRSFGLSPKPSRDGVLHFMNVLVPQSPFDDLPRVARTLQALIGELRMRHPQVRELWCNTWLNDHPAFHDLFPEIWFQNGTVAPPGNFRNWWGQFARRDGDFNDKAAAKFRASGGVFPFRALGCHAGLDAIDQHLSEVVNRTASKGTATQP